jgi:hypothetical protein
VANKFYFLLSLFIGRLATGTLSRGLKMTPVELQQLVLFFFIDFVLLMKLSETPKDFNYFVHITKKSLVIKFSEKKTVEIGLNFSIFEKTENYLILRDDSDQTVEIPYNLEVWTFLLHLLEQNKIDKILSDEEASN